MQKCHLRRVVREPKDWKTGNWIAPVLKINNRILDMDPNAESLSDKELEEIAEFGVPNSFQNEMLRQQFDPIERSMQESCSANVKSHWRVQPTTPAPNRKREKRSRDLRNAHATPTRAVSAVPHTASAVILRTNAPWSRARSRSSSVTPNQLRRRRPNSP